MSAQTRNILLGLGLAVAILIAGHLIDAGDIAYFPAVFLGSMAWYILSNLSSNRKVKNLPEAERSKALASAPPAGTALVYIYRQGFIGKALGVDVAVDNHIVAQLKSPRFTVVAVPPGDHTLAAGLTGFAGAQAKGSATSFSINQGEIAVFGLAMKMGMIEGSIAISREANAREALGKLSMITMVAPEPVPS